MASELTYAGRRRSLGYFDTADEASEVYDLAMMMIFGSFHRPITEVCRIAD